MNKPNTKYTAAPTEGRDVARTGRGTERVEHSSARTRLFLRYPKGRDAFRISEAEVSNGHIHRGGCF